MPRKLVGIDIGNQSIRFITVNNGVITDCVKEPVPDNCVQNGRITAFTGLADFMKEVRKKDKIRVKDAALVLPQATYFIRRVTLPRMTVSQLRINLPYEFHDFIQDDMSKYFYDYAVIRMNDTTMDLMICAISLETEKRYEDMMKRAGFHLVKLVPNVLGLQAIVLPAQNAKQAARKAQEPAAEMPAPGQDQTSNQTANQTSNPTAAPRYGYQDYAIIDFGHGGTRMHFYSKGAYEITRNMNAGMPELVQQLVQERGVDSHIAALMLDHNQDNILQSQELSGSLDAMVTEVMRVLNFYNYNNPSNTIDCLYYCGSDVLAAAMEHGIEEMTGLKMKTLSTLLPEAPEEQQNILDGAPAAYGAVIE